MGGLLDMFKKKKNLGEEEPASTEKPNEDSSKEPNEDASKEPPKDTKVDPSSITCEKKSETQMHCTFTLDEKQFEGLKRSGNIDSGGKVNVTMVGIICCVIILIVLLFAFIYAFFRMKKGRGGIGYGRSLRKTLKSRISGGKSSHHSSALGSSKKRGKSSRLSKKSAGKSGLSSKKKWTLLVLFLDFPPCTTKRLYRTIRLCSKLQRK